MKAGTKVLSVAFAITALVASSAYAQKVPIDSRVNQILVTESPFGGCMIALANNPQELLPSCKAWFVTLSCDGSHLSKDVAGRLMEQAQLAYALDKRVKVWVDDLRQSNGYCLAYRIDIAR
ncbi:MAG: hypothetical protein R3E86_09325 [Pseudomonadales bacterium]